MDCGHCEAVCPNFAIHVEKLLGKHFEPIPEISINENQLLNLMKHRRSVRRYKDTPVPRDVLDKMLEAAHLAPTGTSSRSTAVIVIDTPEILNSLSKRFFALYMSLEKGLKNPIARYIIKRRVGKETLSTLLNFVMPGMQWYIKWYNSGQSNEILRDCPALILFYSPVLEPMASENCLIAAFHTILMAEVLGVGTCFYDLIPPACNRDAEVKKILCLPDNCEVYASITAGYPRYKFQRSIPRRLAEVRYL
jgi:nitroreductase